MLRFTHLCISIVSFTYLDLHIGLLGLARLVPIRTPKFGELPNFGVWYGNGELSTCFASVCALTILMSCTVNYAAHSLG